MKRAVIRKSQHGWVVSIDNDPEFIPFKSNEPERFVKFVAEKIAGVTIDHVFEYRQAEKEAARVHLDRQTRAK